MYPIHNQAINTQWQQCMCWILHWPVKQKWVLHEIEAGLDTMGQAEFTFNEEWLSKENSLPSKRVYSLKLDRLEEIIFQEDRK